MREMSIERRSGPGLERMRATAMRLITEKGLVAFKIKDIADELGLKSPTLPLYYFGTTAGLLAAVAESGFTELSERIEHTWQSCPPDIRRLERLAQTHGRYGLEKPNLYQAMHSSSVWGHARSAAARSSKDSSAAKRAKFWKDRAQKARDRAFETYISAVSEVQQAGVIKRRHEAQRITHLLSTLVDGYLFQVRDEHIQPESSLDDHLRYLRSQVRLAITGLQDSKNAN